MAAHIVFGCGPTIALPPWCHRPLDSMSSPLLQSYAPLWYRCPKRCALSIIHARAQRGRRSTRLASQQRPIRVPLRLWPRPRSPARGAICTGLRHGCGVACIAKGMPFNIMQHWRGHAPLATTAIYVDAVGRTAGWRHASGPDTAQRYGRDSGARGVRRQSMYSVRWHGLRP